MQVSDPTQGLSLAIMQFDTKSGMVLAAMQETLNASINGLHECENKEQLSKYYHASLDSHPKSTLIGAAKSGYLRGFLGLTAEAVERFIVRSSDITFLGAS